MKPQDNVIDPFLQKILISRRNDPHARGIMESIQKKQNQIIYTDFKDNLIVQGCAGSGKTVILFHRLANMEYNIPDFNIKDVLFIAPNNHFKEYIDSFVKSLDIRNIKMFTFKDYLKSVKRYRTKTLESILKLIEISNKSEIELNNNESKKKQLIQSQFDRKKELREKLLSEFLENNGLSYHQNYTSFKNNEDKNTINNYEIFIRAIAKTDEEYTKLEEEIGQTNIKIKRLKNKIILRKKYKYVFIDEGQDYSLLQYKLLKALNPDAVFNIFGDIKQQLSNTGLKNWKDLTSLFEPIQTYSLKENYRNSHEIVEYVVEKLGTKYRMINMGPSMAEVEEISIDEIKQFIQYETQIMHNDEIAIIVSNKKKKTAIQEKLADLNLEKNIKYYSIEEIKGMEYDAVFVCLNNKENSNAQYVAYTRAINAMYIIK